MPGVETWGGPPVARSVDGAVPRHRAVLVGWIAEVRVTQRHGPRCEALFHDGTGSITLRWLGRDRVPGIQPGTILRAEGTVLSDHGCLMLLNPLYELWG
jgi:hypothetical protein